MVGGQADQEAFLTYLLSSAGVLLIKYMENTSLDDRRYWTARVPLMSSFDWKLIKMVQSMHLLSNFEVLGPFKFRKRVKIVAERGVKNT